MIRVVRRCPAHTMKYASLLLGYLLLMSYDVSAREEPVENRIVNTFNNLPAALKNSLPPIELLFVNDFKELHDEVARQRVNTSTLSPRFTAVALNRPAIIFVKSELQKKEHNDDENFRRVVTHEVMHVYDFKYKVSSTPHFIGALENDKLLHKDWIQKYKNRQSQKIYDEHISYFLAPIEAFAEAGSWFWTRPRNQYRVEHYWPELFPNSIMETCSSLAENMIVTKDECWYLSQWITH
jgi:hypothetical protein